MHQALRSFAPCLASLTAALCLTASASFAAAQHVPAGVPSLWQRFDSAPSLAATGLLRLDPGDGLALEPDPRGGKRLALHGVAGFALPTTPGQRFVLAFDLERGKGSGSFLLGNDRDPQHGFSRHLCVESDGSIRVGGVATDLVLPAETRARIRLELVAIGTGDLVVDSLRVSLPGEPPRERAGLGVASSGPLVFRHVGPGTVYVDDLVVAGRP